MYMHLTENFQHKLSAFTDTDTMPILFVGHGAPLYVLTENRYTLAWRKLGEQLPRPKAIVCISAHWLTDGHYVTAMTSPRIIHDFGRFDERLFQIKYPAKGSPELASLLCAMPDMQESGRRCSPGYSNA